MGLGEDTITEAWHHPGKLVPPVYTACDATQPHCAVMAECRLSVTFLTPPYFLAMVFPLPHFCSLFQPCVICPQNHILLFPMSTLYMRELTLVGCFPRLLGQLASSSVQPMGSSSGRQEVGGKAKLEYFVPSVSALGNLSSSDFSSYKRGPPGSSFCIPMSSNITASPCSCSMQVATVSCCCLALTSLSVHTEMSQLLQHLYIYVTNSLE